MISPTAPTEVPGWADQMIIPDGSPDQVSTVPAQSAMAWNHLYVEVLPDHWDPEN
jgi:hypothetical protein